MINLEELNNLVNHYPVEAGNTLSHKTMNELATEGLAVRDAVGRWIPTAKGVIRYHGEARTINLDQFFRD